LCVASLQIGCGDSGTDLPDNPVVGDSYTPSDATRGQAGAGSNVTGSVVEPPTMDPGFPGSAVPTVTDVRAPVIAKTPPPAISGGTMLIADDGVTVVAADSDRDRISIVDLSQLKVVKQIALETGDEPGRLAQDARGLVHIVLRGSGEVATLDLDRQSIVDRREVCGAPRGIAYDAKNDALHVACLGGDLVTLPAGGGDITRNMRVAEDLRDVVVHDGKLSVTQFKAAALLDLDEDGAVMRRSVPGLVRQASFFPDASGNIGAPRSFSAALVRRAIPLDGGRTLLLHQRELNDTIQVQDPHAGSVASASGDGLSDEQRANLAKMDPNGVAVPPSIAGPGGGSAYGGGDGCQSIVQTAVSIVAEDGTIMQSASLPSTVLAVDVAMSPDGAAVAVASAGTRDLFAPSLFGFGLPMGVPTKPGLGGFGGTGSVPFPGQSSLNNAQSGMVTLLSTSQAGFQAEGQIAEPCAPATTIPVTGQPVSVGYTKDGTLVVQSREPATIVLAQPQGITTISLGGDSRLDTGHDLFHRDAGAGIACASCHGEGGDDGHVWNFSDNGARRTQSVNIGLEGTAPFHWAGDLKDLATLMDTVFVGRMGGAQQAPERVDALAGWLFAQQPPARLRAADDESALRGKHLFESKDVGCADCHNGQKLTNNKTVDVGTGSLLQVPSLIGIAFRAPFIHTGCAATLRDRFDPACGGGDKHGHTSGLSDNDIGDIVAYLETL
jgi:hypothetical protein